MRCKPHSACFHRHFSLLLALVLVLSLGGLSASADAAPPEQQINLIAAHLKELIQPDTDRTWYYTVMDFDRNGRLEFYAASLHPADRSTNLKVWEVNEPCTALEECGVRLPMDESFPDIIADSADTFYDANTNTWSCLFYDNIVLSPAEVYTIRCSVSLKDGIIGFQSHAVEHSVLVNSYRYVDYTDENGNPISADQYKSSAADDFAGAQRSSTNFDWVTAKELKDAAGLAYSYGVFAGTNPPTGKSPIAQPPVMEHDNLAPVQGTAGQPTAQYMIITKNPTSEKKRVGESLKFVAGANVYDWCYWTFVKPDGDEVDLDYFQAHFTRSYVDGYYSPVLSIGNLDSYMDGWGAYCTFYFDGQIAVTSTAWMKVKK